MISTRILCTGPFSATIHLYQRWYCGESIHQELILTSHRAGFRLSILHDKFLLGIRLINRGPLFPHSYEWGPSGVRLKLWNDIINVIYISPGLRIHARVKLARLQSPGMIAPVLEIFLNFVQKRINIGLTFLASSALEGTLNKPIR